ncbi:hypothetical protein SAMN02745126_03337 [Enhydrobacter aerosaccus]|uniref:Uncharacterized protein n=1 Tax=Enhydrobacter aerosaccus TaxID=225324 RepID=A0A1T4QNY8_9HYPH|nr:hypothetical protein [Enhydrobacter aerosaccus]SKA05181.1 hypothetical protein SAMN02745126_03337 [Enhydrobacter aerosaccus]
MNSLVLSYPRHSLWADYIRAVGGCLLCGLPLLLLPVERWIGLILASGFVVFALFCVRTLLRQKTRYVLSGDTLAADGPWGSLIEWGRLDRMKLAYYSTKRDRSGGWMQLVIRSAGARTVKIDSSLDGFYDIVERAAQAAEACELELSHATRVNLRSMGISVAGQEETV